jgi:hypothetical protein
MINFRIIAIRTGARIIDSKRRTKTGQKLDPFKVLKPNTIYPFYSHFSFPDNNLTNIKYDNKKDIDLYRINTPNISIPVNLNAVVGSNGSGKSTLLELLNWANYNLGCKLGLLQGERNQKLYPFKFLQIEFVYSVSKTNYFKMTFIDGEIFIYQANLKGNKVVFNEFDKRVSSFNDLNEFFYTVVVNYSHYSFNSDEVGDWIVPLFHKNDGYQTPIVLNPMRDHGVIDVNRERHLLTRRLQANLLEYVKEGQELNSLRNIGNGKIIKQLKLRFNPPSDGSLEESKDPIISNQLKKALEKYFKIGYFDDTLINNVTFNYIYVKLERMAKTYKPFNNHWDKESKKIKNVEEYIRRIKQSDSHIVFKLKGAILYLKYQKGIFGRGEINFKKDLFLDVNKLSNFLKVIERKEDYWINTFMLTPPSFYSVDLIPEDKSSFSNLSSGEKQRMHSISSIVYHLINLNSVEKLKESKNESYVHYKYINIVLDEIELYYHPDWQRKYIFELLDYIGKINPANLKHIKALNFTFLTHSPFILSDIPSSNILFLTESGEPRPVSEEVKTFGANIHDLLKHSFFLRDGSMGAFAVDKINDTINFLNSLIKQKELSKKQLNDIDYKPRKKELDELNQKIKETDSKRHKELIDLVDEPILKNKLIEMYEMAASESVQIELLENRIADLQKELIKKKKSVN